MKPKPSSTYAQMGMAAMLPGMQYMIDLMQEALDDMKSQLSLWQTKSDLGREGGKLGWSSDPEERKQEMKRRQAVARAKARFTDPEWRAKVGANTKAGWAKLTPKQRKARIEKTIAARLAKKAEREAQQVA